MPFQNGQSVPAGDEFTLSLRQGRHRSSAHYRRRSRNHTPSRSRRRDALFFAGRYSSAAAHRPHKPAAERPPSQHFQMPPHGLHISANNRPAEPSRGPERPVIPHRLQQYRKHALPCRFLCDAAQPRHLLGGRQQSCQQRRSKGSPRVIRILFFPTDGIGLASQVAHDASRTPRRRRIALNRKRHSGKRGSRSPNKGHQRMHRSHGGSLSPKRFQGFTAERSARVKHNFPLPLKSFSQR